MSYKLTTRNTWAQTNSELSETFRKWGVDEWKTNYPRGARLEGWNQSESDRTVELKYKKDGVDVTLTMGNQQRAIDNIRVLYLAVEAMRLNEARGIGDVIRSAYLQLAAPVGERDPFEVLGLLPGTSIEIAEAVYKAMALKFHPDKPGGSVEKFKELNKAIEKLRGNK